MNCETKRSLEKRLSEHRGYLTSMFPTKKTGIRFTQHGHSVSDVRLTILEKMKTNCAWNSYTAIHISPTSCCNICTVTEEVWYMITFMNRIDQSELLKFACKDRKTDCKLNPRSDLYLYRVQRK
jgi:hypothetical protein